MSEGIVYFKSGLGNLIQATPAMQAMATLDPSGKVDVCLDSGWTHDSRIKSVEEILAACPFVDRVVRHPAQPHGAYRYGFVPVQCETSKAGNVVLRKMRAVGWPNENWPTTGAHEVDVNMRLVSKATGYRGPIPQKFCPVFEDGPDLSGMPRPLIGICNGAFGTTVWEKKRWPYFKVLARLLKRYYGGAVVGVGAKGELKDVPMDRDFGGELSITRSARAIQQFDLLITTDTCCMHIGDALGIRVLALFGPTLMSKNAPRSPRARMMRAAVACAPCQYTDLFFGCNSYTCMEQLTPAAVMTEVRRTMKEAV